MYLGVFSSMFYVSNKLELMESTGRMGIYNKKFIKIKIDMLNNNQTLSTIKVNYLFFEEYNNNYFF